jgi:hypothetical protein
MNTLEDRVRAALHAHAEDFSAGPDAWARIRARSRAARKRPGRPRWSGLSRFLIPAAAAAAVVAIVVGVTVAVNGLTGRSAGRPAGAGSASPTPARTSPGPGQSPAGPYSSSGPAEFFLADDPPVSAILSFPVTAPDGHTAMAYSWLAYTSSSAWLDQLQGIQSCADVVYPNGASSGFCVPLPRLDADHLASVTASTYMGAKSGPLVLQGMAASQVASVTAVLPDGSTVPGTVRTGRGFSASAWAVAYSPASGVRLVFRDAAGHEIASLSTAGPTEPPQILEPTSGGILAFTYPKIPGISGDSVNAYLIDRYVGFWQGPGNNGYIAPQLAAGPPALAGLSLGFWAPGGTAKHPNMAWEAFGYAHADVARVVLHLPGRRQASTSTFAAWPGSGLRLWAVRLPAGVEYVGRRVPAITATGYNAAGQIVTQVTLGSSG